MKISSRCLALLALTTCCAVLAPRTANAEGPTPERVAPGTRTSAEVNVLWPFFPGGISELRMLLPLLSAGEQSGQAMLGLHSDFSQLFRSDQPKVFVLAAQPGYRQFFWRGLHAELHANLGYAHAEAQGAGDRVHHAFVVSLWGMAGYQFDIGARYYLSARGGVGWIAYTSNPWPNATKGFLPVGDANFGVVF
jgi:hypothetical protein